VAGVESIVAGTVVAMVVAVVEADMAAAMSTDGWITHRAMEGGSAPAVSVCLAKTAQSIRRGKDNQTNLELRTERPRRRTPETRF